MKVGLGIITFVLTIVFSFIAVQNNKIAKEIAIRNFGLDKKVNKRAAGKEDDNKTKAKKIQVLKQKNSFEEEWDKQKNEFDKSFAKF